MSHIKKAWKGLTDEQVRDSTWNIPLTFRSGRECVSFVKYKSFYWANSVNHDTFRRPNSLKLPSFQCNVNTSYCIMLFFGIGEWQTTSLVFIIRVFQDYVQRRRQICKLLWTLTENWMKKCSEKIRLYFFFNNRNKNKNRIIIGNYSREKYHLIPILFSNDTINGIKIGL